MYVFSFLLYSCLVTKQEAQVEKLAAKQNQKQSKQAARQAAQATKGK